MGVRGKYRWQEMKKFGLVSIVAAGLTSAFLGLASPAQADLGHNIWANNQNPSSQNAPSGADHQQTIVQHTP